MLSESRDAAGGFGKGKETWQERKIVCLERFRRVLEKAPEASPPGVLSKENPILVKSERPI